MRDPQGRFGFFRPGARPDPATVLKLIDEHQDRFGAEPVLRKLHIPASTYYRWRREAAEPCERKRHDAELTEHIRRIHADSDAIYGSPRVHAVLWRESTRIGRKRVERLMRQAGLQGGSPRQPQSFTRRDPAAGLAPDLVLSGRSGEWRSGTLPRDSRPPRLVSAGRLPCARSAPPAGECSLSPLAASASASGIRCLGNRSPITEYTSLNAYCDLPGQLLHLIEAPRTLRPAAVPLADGTTVLASGHGSDVRLRYPGNGQLLHAVITSAPVCALAGSTAMDRISSSANP
ncbi:IS3 family transposase [Kitasatospora herbaricolor]|uniref:IS3 family transposase n=1 Tax=Kitasatospora herbaricolor TaxID=68217 RepID=UPI0036DC96E4